MTRVALLADRILTRQGFFEDGAVIVKDASIAGVCLAEELPTNIERTVLTGDLVPGFIDIQVNGGGGVLFNDDPSVDCIRIIAEAHRAFGTTGFLPTLISDDLDKMALAIAAVKDAIEGGVSGVLGIHLEGPFLEMEKRGIHEADKLRRLDDDAIDLLSSLRTGKTLVTLAPEHASYSNIAKLSSRGVIVAAGHTMASYDQTIAAIEHGLSGFTHLFNAMPGPMSRQPGVCGAALDSNQTWCSIIADGHHVHPAMLRLALAAKGTSGLILVTDAMPSVGTLADTFDLGSRRILKLDGRCVSEDGKLAGAHLDMAQAVRNAIKMMQIPAEVAISMATTNPASALGISNRLGCIETGFQADFALLDESGLVQATWIKGKETRTMNQPV